MRLVLEQRDLGNSGKKIEELADPMFGFTVLIEQRPDGQPSTARLKHRGAGRMLFHDEIEIEIEGVGVLGKPAEAEVVAESKKATPKRNKKVDAEPALTSPRLQDNSWVEG